MDKKNKRKYYILSILIFFSGLLMFYFVARNNVSVLKKTLNELDFPGSHTVKLEKDGTYSIYYQFEGPADGQLMDNNNLDTDNIAVSLINLPGGEDIELKKPDSSKKYRFRGRRGTKLYEFNNNGVNEYVISSERTDQKSVDKYVLVIEKGFEDKRVKGILASQAVLVFPTILALILFIRIYIKN